MIEKLVSDSFLDKLKEVMSTPIISKRDLRIGNMFEQGIVWKISGRAGAKVHLHGKGKWYKGFRSEVSVEHLKPILLTHQVLTEWCEFVLSHGDTEKKLHVYQKDGIFIHSRMGFTYIKQGLSEQEITLNGLHELQNWWYWNNNKRELEIKG